MSETAYELADKLDSISINDFESLDQHHYTREASTMLRRQADRIAELEKEAEACWCQGHSKAYLKAKGRLPNQVSSKPVAWWDGNPKNSIGISKSKDCDDWQPLYTHPVKQLSDEEIEIIREALIMIGFRDEFINYDLAERARAIIKEITE